MGKYKKCISCGKKIPAERVLLSDNQHSFVICVSCLRIALTSKNGCNRLIELIRRESQNVKTKSNKTETI